MKYLFCALLLFSFYCYSKKLPPKTVEVEVVHIKPPKRFYVTFRDLETGITYTAYVSKRCSCWRKLKVGDHLFIQRAEIIDTRNNQHIEYDWYNIYQTFCPNNWG